MAQLKFAFRTGATLTYGAYYSTASVRTAAGTSFPENGATGDYVVTDVNVQVGDRIVIREGTTVVGGGVYETEVDGSIVAVLAALTTVINLLEADTKLLQEDDKIKILTLLKGTDTEIRRKVINDIDGDPATLSTTEGLVGGHEHEVTP